MPSRAANVASEQLDSRMRLATMTVSWIAPLPLIRSHRDIIQSHAVQQHLKVRMLPDGVQPGITAQKNETVGALGDGLIEQGHGALGVSDAEIRGGRFIWAYVSTRARSFLEQRQHL